MQKYLTFMLLILFFSATALEWKSFTPASNTTGINFKGPDKELIQFYSSTRKTDTLQAKLHPDFLDLTVNAMQPGEQVKLRFFPGRTQEISGRRMTLKITASSSSAEECAIFLEGQVDPKKNGGETQKTHFWKRRIQPLRQERTLLTLTAELPKGLTTLSVRLDIQHPGNYRIYDVSLEETPVIASSLEPGKNYLANGGAERGWYGTAGWNFDYVKMHDSGQMEIWKDTMYR